MNDPYTPIPCAAYDQFEVAILHRRPLMLTWAEGEALHRERVTPVTLETRAGEEFLHARTLQGGLLRLRLDHIHRAETA